PTRRSSDLARLAAAAPGTGATRAVSFSTDVLPIFQASCVGCHGNNNPQGGLTLTAYAIAMKGGKGGPEIVPGKSADSRLVKFLLGTLQPKMPLNGALKPAEISLIRRWID